MVELFFARKMTFSLLPVFGDDPQRLRGCCVAGIMFPWYNEARGKDRIMIPLKIKGFFIGKLISATDKAGAAYQDWRCRYVDLAGLVDIYVDGDGRELFHFYPVHDLRGGELRTSPGHSDYDADTKRLRLRTRNSVYIFEVDTTPLNEMDRELDISSVQEWRIVHAAADGKTVGENGYYKL